MMPRSSTSVRAIPRGRSIARSLVLVGFIVLLGVSHPGLVAGQTDTPDSPAGVYNLTVSRGDIPPEMAGGPELIGQWRIEFVPDGTYNLGRLDVGVIVSGSYEVEGATVTLVDEAGLLACGGGQDEDLATATYAWELDNETLRLTPIEERCETRRLLLSTRSLGGFATCDTDASELSAVMPGSEASPSARRSAEDDATPAASPEGGDGQDSVAVENAIDDLLAQASGCWATGDPTRFLPLHSEAVLNDLAAFGPPDQFLAQLATFMATPLSFERVGDIEFDDSTHVSAYVVLKFGQDEVPLRFEFVQENGRWLLDFFFITELLG